MNLPAPPALRHDENDLLGLTPEIVALDAPQWEAFMKELERAPVDNPRLRRLLQTKSVFDE